MIRLLPELRAAGPAPGLAIVALLLTACTTHGASNGDDTNVDTAAITTVERDCADGADDDNDGNVDCLDNDCGLSPECCACTDFIPRAVFVSGEFAYFADSQTIGAARTNVETHVPRIDLTLQASPDDQCTISFVGDETTELPAVTWADYDDFWSVDTNGNGEIDKEDELHPVTSSAVGFVADGFTVDDECTANGRQMDVDKILAWAWGLGVGTMRDDVSQMLTDAGANADLYGGGAVHFDGLPGKHWPDGVTEGDFSVGYQVDETGDIVVDTAGRAVTLDMSDVRDGTPPSGFYEVRAAVGIAGGDMFAR